MKKMKKNDMDFKSLSEHVGKCNNRADNLLYSFSKDRIHYTKIDEDLYLFIDNGIAIIELNEDKTIMSCRMMAEDDIDYLPKLRKYIVEKYEKDISTIDFILEKQRLRTIFHK